MTEKTWQAHIEAGNKAYSENRTVQAEQHFLQALELSQSANQDEHTATSLNNLAAIYHTQGKYAWAEERYQQALAIQKRLFGAESLQAASSLHNLALLCSAKRRYAEAEQLYLQTIKIREKLLGADHLDLKQVLSNYAQLLRRTGKVEEAQSLELKLK